MVLDYVDKLDDYAESNAPANLIIFKYYKNYIPYFAALFSSLFTFISVIFFTSRLAYRNEVIAILATGTSYYRFLVPYVVGALVIVGLSLYATHYVVPRANVERHDFEHIYVRNPYVNKDRNIHMQLTENSYMYIENFNVNDSTGYKFALEKFDGTNLVYKLRADRVVWDHEKRLWQIRNFQIRTISGLEEDLAFGSRLDTLLNFSPRDFVRKVQYTQNLTTPELKEFIELERSRGSDEIEEYEVEMHKRTSTPFAAIILTLMGVSIASRKVTGRYWFVFGNWNCSWVLLYIIDAVFIHLCHKWSRYTARRGLDPEYYIWIDHLIPDLYCAQIILYLILNCT